MYIEQKYGGHLGFYQGGLIWPHATSWLDQTVVELSNALTLFCATGKAKMTAQDFEASSVNHGAESVSDD